MPAEPSRADQSQAVGKAQVPIVAAGSLELQEPPETHCPSSWQDAPTAR